MKFSTDETFNMPALSPLRVAIIGSGPAAFYSAGSLLDKVADAEIDMFERLPTPHGLVRGGVAPDHPKIKNVTKVYDKIAADSRFRFYGHVEFGRDITLGEVREHYHAVIYATGAQTDRKMSIPGEDLPGSFAATEFVGWYNAHPDFQNRHFDLTQSAVAIIGNGNVAMDVARILASNHEELAHTDISDEALAALSSSQIKTIYILGRRGPAQAAFTNIEIKEFGALADAEVVISTQDATLDPLSAEDLAAAPSRIIENNLKTMTGYAAQPPQGKKRQIVMRFLVSPAEILGETQVQAIRVVDNELIRSADGSLRPRATDKTEIIPVGLVFRSIGYKGVPLLDVPFDSSAGVIPNKEGRVIEAIAADGELRYRLGEYCAGWIKRGPSGVIGTNKPDAVETVEHLIEDAAVGLVLAPETPTRAAVDALLASRNIDVVSYADWLRLDADEQAHGAAEERPRVKYSHVEDMMRVIHETEPATLEV